MSKKKQLSNWEISVLCSELGTIVQSGVTITDGIFILAQDETDKNRVLLLQEMLGTIENGGTVQSAFEEAGVFPEYFLEMTAVGEKTGRLDTVLLSMSEYYARLEDMSSSIKSAVVYPTVLLITIFAVIAVLAVYVLPVFSEVFAQLGLTMSEGAGFIMSLGEVISSTAVYIIGAIALVIVAAVLLYHFVPPVKRAVLSAVSHTKTAKALYSARFANALSMTLSSGLDIDESLLMSEKLIVNPHMREKIAACRREMSGGKPFTEALGSPGVFSSLHTRMINLGFSTGTLDTVMKKIAVTTENRVNDVINTVVSRFEPTMVVIMAVAVGFILLSVMLPLLGIMTVIG